MYRFVSVGGAVGEDEAKTQVSSILKSSNSMVGKRAVQEVMHVLLPTMQLIIK